MDDVEEEAGRKDNAGEPAVWTMDGMGRWCHARGRAAAAPGENILTFGRKVRSKNTQSPEGGQKNAMQECEEGAQNLSISTT